MVVRKKVASFDLSRQLAEAGVRLVTERQWFLCTDGSQELSETWRPPHDHVVEIYPAPDLPELLAAYSLAENGTCLWRDLNPDQMVRWILDDIQRHIEFIEGLNKRSKEA